MKKRKPAVLWRIRWTLKGKHPFFGDVYHKGKYQPEPCEDTGWIGTPVKFVEQIPKRKKA